jgi:dienelactone hydrolase
VPADDLVAEVFEPPGDGPHPGVVLLGGSGGGFPSRRAASLLASRGFAVLALAYFGVGDLPRRLVEVPFEYVDRAVDWFAAEPVVAGPPLGVVGWSRGGELALLTGARCDRVRTVVAYVPSPVVFQGNAVTNDPGSAWALDGEPHPYVPLSPPPAFRARAAARWLRRTPLAFRPLFERGLRETPEPVLDAATIPVEEIGGPVQLVTGGDDRVWPAADLATRAMARLDACEYPHRYGHLRVPGAGHDIKVPHHPTTERAVRGMPLPGFPLLLAMGGTAAGYARADRRAWEYTLDTLRHGLVDS